MQNPSYPGANLQKPVDKKQPTAQHTSGFENPPASNGPPAFAAAARPVGAGVQAVHPVSGFPSSSMPRGPLPAHPVNGMTFARPPFGAPLNTVGGRPPQPGLSDPATASSSVPAPYPSAPTTTQHTTQGPLLPRQPVPPPALSAGSRPPVLHAPPPAVRPSAPPLLQQPRPAGATMRPPPQYGRPPVPSPPMTAIPSGGPPAFTAGTRSIGPPPPAYNTAAPPVAATRLPSALHPAAPPPHANSSSSTTAVPAPPAFGRPPAVAPPTPTSQPYVTAPQQPPSSSSKIDPARIPRPDNADDGIETFETRNAGAHAIPPPSTARYVVRDVGECSPRYMRITLNNLPTTSDMLRQTGLPLALAIQPLAVPEAGDDAVQVVDFGESGPVRCKSEMCRAYINPFFKWLDGGHKFQCNFCGSVSPCPPDYFCHTGPDGRRRDAEDRQELSKGSVEFVATAAYMVRPPMPPTHFFLIDVSYNAVHCGAVAAVCSSLLQLLDDLQGGDRVRVGIATFDSSIHFYRLQPGQASPQMLVVPDVNEVYTPAEMGLVVTLQEARQLVSSTLSHIPALFAASTVSDTAGGAAIKGAVEILKRGFGGQLHVFVSSLPKLGLLPLTLRDTQTGEKEILEALQPATKDWKKLAEEAAEFQVCVDLFVMAQSYVDVASLSTLSSSTGGQLYCYPKFNQASDTAQLFNDLRWNLVRPQGLEAIARLRCSTGLSVSSYMGSCYQRLATDVEFPVCSSDNTLVARLTYDEKLRDNSEAYFQYALLYTTPEGSRRIRVHTLSVTTTSSLGQLFKGADLDVFMCVVARSAAASLPGGALAAARDAITKACVDPLVAYRKHCASSSSSGQLILPESLKLLPLYCLGLHKSMLFRIDSKVDTRAAWGSMVEAMPVHRLVPVMYPRFIALHRLLDAYSQSEDGETAMGRLPQSLPLSAEKVDQDGAYLVENGMDCLILLGRDSPVELLQQLLDVSSLAQLGDANVLQLPALNTPLSKAVLQAINLIRQQRGSYMRLRIIKRGDPLDVQFFSMLTEDKSHAGMSYVEYLCVVHRQIQNKLN